MIRNMVRWLFVTFAALMFGTTVEASNGASPRSVLAAHDPEGRLPNTSIRKLGAVKVKTSTFVIYYLEFVNPVSHYGQQRIAIIKNGKSFSGSYQCTLRSSDTKLIVGKDQLTAWVRGVRKPFVIKFDKRGPTRNTFFCGEGSGWENSI